MKEGIPPDIIDDYLKGKMTPAEREQFEQRMADDPKLARELVLRRAEMAASELLIAAETRDLFREWEQQLNRSIFSAHPGLWWLVGIAAGFLLFIVAIRVLKEPPAASPPAVEQTAPIPETPASVPEPRQPVADVLPEKSPSAKTPSKNYRTLARRLLPDPALSNLRRPTTDSVVSVFRRAQLAFEASDYQKTLDLLAQVDSTRQQSAIFLSAHALFHLNRFAEAEAQFTRLVEANSRQYRYASEWGVLMCRLAGDPNRRPEFRQQLNDILANPDHPYFGQAKALEKVLLEQ